MEIRGRIPTTAGCAKGVFSAAFGSLNFLEMAENSRNQATDAKNTRAWTAFTHAESRLSGIWMKWTTDIGNFEFSNHINE